MPRVCIPKQFVFESALMLHNMLRFEQENITYKKTFVTSLRHVMYMYVTTKRYVHKRQNKALYTCTLQNRRYVQPDVI